MSKHIAVAAFVYDDTIRANMRACLKIPERDCVVLDPSQQTSNFRRASELATCCGWSATQPRSFFGQALTIPELERSIS
jgi:hypothetical protein